MSGPVKSRRTRDLRDDRGDPRYVVSWSLPVAGVTPQEAARRAFFAACIDFDRQTTLVKVREIATGKEVIVDWATHAVCGTPQPELTPVYKHPARVDLSLLWRCQFCGSWDVQISYPAWHAPNEGYKYVFTDEEADHMYEWCNHCEATDGIVRADEWDMCDVATKYNAHADFWTEHPPGTAPVNPEEIPK